ncbi:MAG: gamma-glutamylcyclotransferase [Sphingosinicella sp.]|nr:gamma-glutamylcyclotransferase [Sphingosinicella sp.]
MANLRSHLLFSYGTLRQDDVQRALFGRLVEGQPDAVKGYVLSTVRIDDPDVVAKSGSAVHPIMVATGDPADEIEGMVFTISDSDLAAVDRYETAAYRRVEARLRSGRRAWAYEEADRSDEL